MSPRRNVVGPAALLAAALWAVVSPPIAGADERFRVCSITINSDDEIKTFKKQLPESQFEFVELTQPASREDEGREPGWFSQSCAENVRCDVLVVSGHFSDVYAGSYGTTFAGKPGLSLALDALESRSCDQSCPGVLGAPLEVFLFGCRTLATGLESRPLPKKDRALLEKVGVSPAASQEILEELRNHGEETSNQRRMRFAFRGVPHVYGFSWTAPTGAPLAPQLDAYFHRVADYAEHLKQIARRRAVTAPEPPNAELARTLRSGTFAQYVGFGPADPELRHDVGSCFLRSRRNSVAARLDRIETLLAGPGFFVQLPAIADFLRTADPAAFSPEETAVLERIRAHEPTRQATLDLVRGLESPALRLELLRVAQAVGWMTADEALPVQRDVVRRLFEPPVYGEQRDLLCGMDPATLQKIDLHSDEIPPKVYEGEFGIAALGCLKPRDPEVHARLGKALSDSRSWIARAAARALEAIAPSRVDVQLELVRQLSRSEVDLRGSAEEALRKIKPSDPQVLSAIRQTDPSFAIDWQ